MNNITTISTISAGTIARTLALVLALVNQLLAALGKSPLPIASEEATQLISTALTMAAALLAWWKNNSFTRAGRIADSVLESVKLQEQKG